MSILDFEAADARQLLNFVRLNLQDRFMGSTLGVMWAVANPLLMLAIFTFVFGFVFKSRLPGANSDLAFVIWLISGYGPWLAVSESITTSTTSVVGAAGMVKNLAFKTELLPLAGTLMGFVPLAVSLVFLFTLILVNGRSPSWTWFYLIPVIAVQFVMLMGIGLFLAALNVFIRDVSMALPNILIMILFASPIFYPIDAFPRIAQAVSHFNPFFVLAEGYRQPLLYDRIPPTWTLVYISLIAGVCFTVGLGVFRRAKGYFDARL